MTRSTVRRWWAGLALTALACGAIDVPAAGDAGREPVADPVLSGPLSLDDAIRTALERNRPLRKALEERNVAAGRLLESWGEALPTVTLDGRYDRQDRENRFEFDGAELVAGVKTAQALDLTVTQPIFKGGRTSAALRASRLYRTLSDELVRAAVQQAVYDTTRSYYQVLLYQKQYGVAQNALTLAESLLKDVETKRKYGVASDFNVLRAQVEVSNARASAIRIKNELRTAGSDLYRTLGVAQTSEVDLTEALTFEPLSPDEEATVREALERRPDVTGADLQLGLQGEAVKVARSDWFPSLEAYFTETLSKPDPRILNANTWGDGWRAGLTLSFTLFDGLGTKGRVAQERARLRQREIDLEDVREQARFEVRRALLDLEDAAEAVDAQKKTVEQADEGLRLAQVGYREGTLDQVAVLEARAALTQAQYFYFEALHAHAIARLDLERARGTLPDVAPHDAGPRAGSGG